MIQQLNSVDQYCCLFHIVHQHTQVLLSKEAMHRVYFISMRRRQRSRHPRSRLKTQDAAETRHSAAPTGCASSRARACYGATTNEAD
eukprot:COSAG01_NODE_1690_length_9443_cov_19.011078_9_plen_87_part_00